MADETRETLEAKVRESPADPVPRVRVRRPDEQRARGTVKTLIAAGFSPFTGMNASFDEEAGREREDPRTTGVTE